MHSELQIPGYSIQSQIGQGGMATVYLAIQESLARTVALKIMSPQVLPELLAEERFLKEAKIVARLSHPNIVTVYDIGRAHTCYYMAMEYIDGGSLIDRIHGGLPVSDIHQITVQVAKALSFAHNQGFVHRDVKPANILFKKNGTVVLSDFGIAKAIRSDTTHLTVLGQMIGTPEYMSPEQSKGEQLDLRSDLYSLGIVVYEMLTGEKPFKGTDALSVAMKQVVDPPPPLPQDLETFQPLLDKLLAKNPDDRFTTAELLIQALDELFDGMARLDNSATRFARQLSQNPTQLSSRRTFPKKPEHSRRRTVLMVLLLASLVATGGGVYNWQIKRPLNPQTRKVVDLLLNQAELQMENSNLLENNGANAHEYYKNVLEFDPHNAQALAGLVNFAGRIEDQVRSLQLQENYDEALVLVKQGVVLYPEKSIFRALQENLTNLRDEKQRLQKIADLLDKAMRQKAEGKILTPQGDDAYESYSEVLELDPRNQQALQELRNIADDQENQAQDKRLQGRLDEALALTEQGLQIDPGHRNLATLQQELNQELAAKQAEQRINRLFEQAEEHIEAARLFQPEGNNALESYRAVQDIEPDNPDALAGLEAIGNRIEAEAITAQKKGQFDQALTLIEQGLRVVPDDNTLATLRTEVNLQLEESASLALRAEQEQQEARKVEQRIEMETQALLERANRQRKDSKLAEPSGDNVLETLQSVLALEPENREALAGLDAIAVSYEGLSKRAASEGRIQDAVSAATNALKATPGEPRLLELKEEVSRRLRAEQGFAVDSSQSELLEVKTKTTKEIEEEQTKKKLEELLTLADQQMAELKLTRPQGNSAYDSYSRALQLSPKENRAQAGLQSIADRYLRLGRARLDDGAFQESLIMIDRGLEVVPEHPGLLRLKVESAERAKNLQREKIQASTVDEISPNSATEQKTRDAETEIEKKDAESTKRRVFGTF